MIGTRKLVAFIAVALLGVADAQAEYRQIDLSIFGMDWAICAHAVRVTMEKLPGVESVKVSLNEGLATIQLKPANAVTMAQIRQSVKRNGFTPQQAVISAETEVIGKGDRLQLRISGTTDNYDFTSAPNAAGVQQQLRKSAGQRVVIEGIIPAQKDRRATPVLQVNSVKPVTR